MELKVNGQAVALPEIASDPAMPLLWVLRDGLNLTGTKYGCGIGACGACTVHVDGQTRRSCVTPIGTLDGAEVVTIEGAAGKETEAVRAAWVALDVPQCGYCQAGQIMTAAALLRRTPRPTDADIDLAMSGNLCRCATYIRIREAIHRAAGNSTSTTAQVTPAIPRTPNVRAAL